MHPEVMAWVRDVLEDLPPRQSVVEIGSYDVNGSVRPLFGGTHYVGVDLRDGLGVDVVGDGTEYEPEEPPDTVVCCEVLEHTADAEDIIANAYRMLKRRGYFIATMAMDPRPPHGINGGHPGDEHYANIDPDDLAGWLDDFAEVDMEQHPDRGDLYVVARKG